MFKKAKYFLILLLTLPSVSLAAELKLSEKKITGKGVDSSLEAWILNFANFFLGFALALTVLFIVIGGFQYMTSGGNDDKTGKAKKTLTYAFLGLIVILLALTIVNFITGKIGDFFA